MNNLSINDDTFTMLSEYRAEQNLKWDKFFAELLYDALQWREMLDEKIELMNK